jgi:DNA segregation ATPase FtsK/SpoIIIE-like protein
MLTEVRTEKRDVAVERAFAMQLYDAVVVTTLRQRGLIRGAETPKVWLVVCLPERIIYLLDMERLAGVPIEKWEDPNLKRQLQAAAAGRRVVVTTEGGIAVQIARNPQQALPKPEPLPAVAPLDLNTRPRAPYSIGIGVGHDGEVWAPLGSLGHMMVSGQTGSGKSYFLRSLAYQLINLPRSQPVTLYLADRAGNVFTPLDAYRVPQLAMPVAKTPGDIHDMLAAAVDEMGQREHLFDAATSHFPDKLDEYNRIPDVEKLPRVVVVLDEVTVLVEEAGGKSGELHRLLLTLAAQGRKYGFTLVVAGQDFKATTFNTALTHQLSTRVAFKAGSANESRVVLGVDGAERLPGQGRGLLRHSGRVIEFQGFLVEKVELVARCAALGEPIAPGPALSDLEVRLIKHAMQELDGAFSQIPLYEAFRDQTSRHAIKTISDRLLADGLLVEEQRGDDRVAKRWVTPKLAALARDFGA